MRFHYNIEVSLFPGRLEYRVSTIYRGIFVSRGMVPLYTEVSLFPGGSTVVT